MFGEASDRCTRMFRRDIGDGMYAGGTSMQHGKSHHVIEHEINRQPVRDRSGAMGWRRGPYYR